MRRSSLWPLLCLCLVTSTAGAQTQGSPSQVSEIKFDGGTLEAYVRYLRTRFPNSSNIIVDGVGAVPLPKVDLRTTLSGALGWVANVAVARDSYVSLHTIRTDSGPVYTFTSSRPRTLRADSAANARLVKTYAVLRSDAWVHPSGEELRTLLNDLMRKRSDTAGVYFDSKAGLLVVSAPASDIRIADQVIEEMGRARRTALASSTTALQDRIRDLTRQKDSLEAVIKELRRTK